MPFDVTQAQQIPPISFSKAILLEDNPDSARWLEECLISAFPGIRTFVAYTLAEACEEIQQQYFDIALVDLDLPDGSGNDFIRALADTPQGADTVAIVATMFADDLHIFPALQAGAKGYLLKDQDLPRLVSDLQGIVDGRPALSPAIARRVLGYFQTPAKAQGTDLTAREREVLQFIGKGLRVSEIAELMSISHHTTADYVKTIYRKLNINSRAEAAVEAVKRGLVNV